MGCPLKSVVHFAYWREKPSADLFESSLRTACGVPIHWPRKPSWVDSMEAELLALVDCQRCRRSLVYRGTLLLAEAQCEVES